MTIGKEQLRLMPRDQQITLWHNAITCIKQSRSSMKSKAELLLRCLECVWRDETHEKMNEQADSNGLVFFDTPECGLLRTMGYRVGVERTDMWLRREILQWVLFREIPFVHSAGYMWDWGAPGSSSRARKLNNSFMGFIEGASGRASHMQAVNHWHEDQCFVRENYLSNAAAE